MYLYVVQNLNLEETSKDVETRIMQKVRDFGYKLSQRWTQCSRNKTTFFNNNKLWLNTVIDFSDVQPTEITQSDSEVTPSTSRSRDRPQIDFSKSSEKTKRRKLQSLLKTTDSGELVAATQISLYREGHRDAAALLKEITITSPKRATRVKKAFHSPPSMSRKLSQEEALATYLDGKMSKRSYTSIQMRLKSIGCKVLPSYHALIEAKKKCYPDVIEITEVSAEISLQALINHTVQRICEVQEEVLVQMKNELSNVHCLFKWGCDGSSGYSSYKQRFSQAIDKQEDNAIFVISMVPIQLYSVAEKKKHILRQNPAPSSTRYCRPIKILFKSETDQVIKTETTKVKRQIEHLQPVSITIEDKEVLVEATLIFCMVDGKICNTEMNVSSQKCYICGCTPKDMNDKTKLESKIDNPESYQYGLSPLHARIRSFECLLRIAYRLEVKKWQVRSTEDKEKVAERKKTIQEMFRDRMGLLVDAVKAGYGTSNDGNTARRFFENPSESAAITGIDETLIKDFAILLQAICSGYEIDENAFSNHAARTLERYMNLYPWYCMPVTVHKLLIHGRAIIKHAILPIGQLTEDAQECRHKEIKFYREHSTRKHSRKASMEDLIHTLLFTSDPVITSYRKKYTKSLKSLSPEVLSLLKEPTPSTAEAESHSDSSPEEGASDDSSYYSSDDDI